ncbi:MAG: LuxR C-terminal-related transcriptional regulator [Dehalococcoidia bacterium]
MPPHIQYAATADGVSIACCALGAGPPLIVLPSGPWGPIQLEWQVPAWLAWYQGLARRRQMIRYDSRGTGLSEGAAMDFSLEAQVKDLEAVARRLAPDQTGCLFAAQTSGPAAISYAAQNPERVSQLILWCTYSRRADYTAFSRTDAFHELMERDWELFTETATHALLGWTEGETAHQLATLMRETFTPQRVQAFHLGTRDLDVTELLPQVQAPTLVMQRRQAPPGVAVAQGLASGIPGASLLVLEGESVAPFLGDASGVAQAVAGFLGDAQITEPAPPRTTSAELLLEAVSQRELEVLQWLATGRSNQEIADELFITLGTVKTHVQSIYRKLEVRNRTRAVARGRELNLIG